MLAIRPTPNAVHFSCNSLQRLRRTLGRRIATVKECVQIDLFQTVARGHFQHG